MYLCSNSSTTGTLQSFQSSDEFNHERLAKTLSWDEEEEGEAIGDQVDKIYAQAIQDPEFLRELTNRGLLSEEEIEEAEEDIGEGEEEENEKRDSGYGSQGQIKKPVSGLAHLNTAEIG